MKIVIIGKSGQLAFELSKLPTNSELVCLGRDEIDITDFEKMSLVLNSIAPEAIINASAYTAVDKAEVEESEAYLINHLAVENLANYAHKNDCHLVHVSTDYVFGGDKGSPYAINDGHNPKSVYGASKAKGELVAKKAGTNSHCIIRTSWVYSSHGNNFVKTMLRLMQSKPSLSVIDDQIGSPTWAKGLATACLYAAENRVVGTHHWTDAGVASWFDFAVAIQRIGMDKGILKNAIEIYPISTSDYPTPAKRPSYSVLDKTSLEQSFKGIQLKHWEMQLSAMLDEIES
jgi:dTDP-4-dehydrorhamnose reductase